MGPFVVRLCYDTVSEGVRTQSWAKPAPASHIYLIDEGPNGGEFRGEVCSKTSQYENSSAKIEIKPRMSPRLTRSGSICAATTFRIIASSDVGPQPAHTDSNAH